MKMEAYLLTRTLEPSYGLWLAIVRKAMDKTCLPVTTLDVYLAFGQMLL